VGFLRLVLKFKVGYSFINILNELLLAAELIRVFGINFFFLIDINSDIAFTLKYCSNFHSNMTPQSILAPQSIENLHNLMTVVLLIPSELN
jgi:hypothetical protein